MPPRPLLLILLLAPLLHHAHSSYSTRRLKRGKRIDIWANGGDILQLRQRMKLPQGAMRNALPPHSPFRWTRYKKRDRYFIPYIISGTYDSEERDIISEAMTRIQNNTCVGFRKRFYERDFLDIQNERFQGCYTTVGRLSGRNVVMLEANAAATCVEPDIVVHELMHAVGLWHEHMRFDRDDFIKVHFENIDPNYHLQFEKIPTSESSTYSVPYDYRSVMHYAKDAFAKKGVISMETIDHDYQEVIGRVNDAAPSDYRKICALYECPICMGLPFEKGDWTDRGGRPSTAGRPTTTEPPSTTVATTTASTTKSTTRSTTTTAASPSSTTTKTSTVPTARSSPTTTTTTTTTTSTTEQDATTTTEEDIVTVTVEEVIDETDPSSTTTDPDDSVSEETDEDSTTGTSTTPEDYELVRKRRQSLESGEMDMDQMAHHPGSSSDSSSEEQSIDGNSDKLIGGGDSDHRPNNNRNAALASCTDHWSGLCSSVNLVPSLCSSPTLRLVCCESCTIV